MATINREFFIAQFREEVNDHIQKITQRLFQIEEQPSNHAQFVEEIFRIAHTLKGSARMMGYTDISALAHKMEDLLVEIRNEHVEPHSMVADLLFYTLDTINYLSEGISKHVKRSANIDEISMLFQDVIAGKQIHVPQLQAQAAKPSPQEQPFVSPAKPGMIEPLPELEEEHYVRIHTTDLDTMLNLVGEVLTNQYRYEGQLAAYHDMIQAIQAHRRQLAELHPFVRDEHRGDASVFEMTERLELSAADMLRNMKALTKNTRTDGQQTHQIVDKLQKHVIDIRMVPAARIFNLLPRLVRITSRRLGKSAEIAVLGEETRIDSRIIEEIRDPLIHLVQNAVHHGIELPEERQQRGKNPTGKVTVSARQEGNRIVIRVQDDGQGIQIDAIKNVALKSGVLSQKDSRNISEQDVFDFLFLPGFTTAELADDIAGRGFGLNIVRTHVDRVQGEIDVRSRAGHGAEFLLKLPLTLTIMNALLVRVANDTFALPTIAVEKTFDISAHDLEQVGNIAMALVDGALLPVVSLYDILHCAENGFPENPPPGEPPQSRLHQTVIVIQAEEHRIGLLVDDLIEEREIVIKHLGPCLKRVKNLAGATVIRGDVVVILYVRDVVHSAELLLESLSDRPPIS